MRSGARLQPPSPITSACTLSPPRAFNPTSPTLSTLPLCAPSSTDSTVLGRDDCAASEADDGDADSVDVDVIGRHGPRRRQRGLRRRTAVQRPLLIDEPPDVRQRR